MDYEEDESKLATEINCISHVEIKEEVIFPDNSNDSESTLSDNEKGSDVKFDECMICCKYRSMFIILKNHDCLPMEADKKCSFCLEICHWTSCFKIHKDSHESGRELDHSSDSTTSDQEENEEKCKVCFKYEFMLSLLKSHICEAKWYKDRECHDCTEVLHWSICYKNHIASHEGICTAVKMKEEISSDSTNSDSEEIHKVLCQEKSRGRNICRICLKYEVMLIILEENHECVIGKVEKKCEKCIEIFHWYTCFENHKKSHFGNLEKQQLDKNLCCRKFGGKSDCGICLKLNSILTELVKNHACRDSKSCSVCDEVSYWLSCLKNHKESESKSDLGEESDCERGQKVKNSERRRKCGVCTKFQTAICALGDHKCRRKEGREKCKVCVEFSFWSRNYSHHESHHAKQILPTKSYFTCSNCGKRFSGENMIHVHKSYCKKPHLACELCNKRFINIFSLKKHKIFHSSRDATIHLKYKCHICKKIFSASSDLRNHEAVHGNIKLFNCSECLVEFKSEFSLKRHKRVHR